MRVEAQFGVQVEAQVEVLVENLVEPAEIIVVQTDALAELSFHHCSPMVKGSSAEEKYSS